MDPPSTLPRAEANDQRSPAGQMVDGELRIELLAVEAEWYPRGPDGPRVMTPAFAEVDGAPKVPGPLIRASVGTPVQVTVHNRLDRPIAVRGLLDRASMAADTALPGPGPFPTFAFAEPLVVPPGETRDTRFTPTAEVSSFYYAHALPPGSGAEDAPPFGTLQEGAFMGALLVDPADSAARQDERVLMITRWNSFTEGPTQKVMANGLSWPFTERLEYTVGDTVRWRVINASNLDHPMHLHGFYFTVDALGDTQADTIYPAGERPLAVTQMLEEFSAMRLTWLPEQPGNWLFHCHLVRHMAFPQRFASESEPGPTAHEAHDGHRMDNMAGLITGVTVHPAAGAEEPEESPVRRIDLWTGERPDVYDGDPELGFVVQEGTEPPAPDSTIVPGSPLVLTRGEPTEIVVHNRLDFPLSVHWHGLELRSVYDGVGGWSGYPGATRPPIPPGDSIRVLITPPRAGSFMYHIHGEPGHELSQGLYGPFLVLEPGEERDADTDRVYTLADRGATGDAAPAINGETRPDPQTFQTGHSYRLRFLQISADAFKRVRLLRDGEPVHWRPLAKDGADLPEAARELGPAALGIGVGETFDVEWQPETPGVYVLEVTTEFFPAVGGTVVQRVAFGVGDVAESELLRAQQPAVAIDMPSEERARYVGTFVGPQAVGGDEELVLSVWEEQERLYATLLMPVEWDDDGTPERLFPVGDGSLAPGRELDGLRHLFSERYRFREAADGGLGHLDAEFGGQVVAELARVPHLELAEPRLRRFEGAYGTAGASGTATVTLDDGVLTLVREGGPPERLVPISSTRFAVEGESGMRVDFELDDGRAAGLSIIDRTGARTPLPAAASDTVHVAPPTGEKGTDRQSILSALDAVRPGGTVQFAEGMYVLGEMVDVAVPRVTLVGHPGGTILRGCDPAAFEDREAAVAGCNGLSLVGGHQTLRGLTFEYTWLAVLLGGPQCNAQECPAGTLPIGSREGGYVVEGNTFRETPNGIRLVGQWTEPAVIRDNRFINTYHAVVVRGMTAHILDNRISVPDPGRVPTDYHPGLALMIGGWEEPGMPACDHNVIAGNRIQGHPDAIAILLFPGGTCRQNVIRDNEIEMSPVRFASPSPAIFVRSADDSTVAGVPIALLNGPMGQGIIEDNIIEGNRIIGAEGVAIEVLNASRNRIRNNTISGVCPRDPFPGNTLFPNVPEWGESNGSGIWVSPGSVDNEISGNSFEDVALHDVVLEGKGNFDTLEVDGRSVRVYSRGIDSRAQDSPLVVFEGGSTTPIDAWLGVVEALGDGIPFLAYDPPGIGQSEWDGVRPTPERVSERLRRTLARAGADPPYVVVGHSWAGWTLRAFEGMYSDDVAGLVLIDPTPSSSRSGFDAAFAEVEASAEDRATFFELMEGMLSAAPAPVRERQAVIDEYRHAGADPEVPDYPSVPFVVLSAGRYDTAELPGAEELAFDVPAFFDAMRRLQTTTHGEWVSGSEDGTLIYVDSLPHCIHCVEPELVARAIRQVAVGDHDGRESDAQLRKAPHAPTAQEQGSIAVLPFADMSPAKDQEYFSDGIAEELQDVLAQLPELRVAFRTSAFAFKGKELGIDSIARALNVGHILKGSARKAGDHVRITAQLIDTSARDYLWSETYDRELKDIFRVQDEIAREIVDHLQLQLEMGGGRAGAVLAKEETRDPEAHVLFLRGRRLFREFTREGLEEAEALLKQAIARDPTYARVHAALASVYRNQAEQRYGPVEALMGQARAALERALELDPNLARAHYVGGWMAHGSGDWHAAEARLARATELNPGYAPAHAFRAILLAILGRTEEAIAAAERAAVLDPFSLTRQTDVATAYIYARRYERAADAAQSAMALDAGRASTVADLAFIYALMDRHAEAIRTGERARDQAPQEQWPLTTLGYAYARAGRRTEAEAVLRALEGLPEPDPYLRAIVYGGLGERDTVFSLLEQAVAERNALVAGLGVDPVFDPYRSDPRMKRLLELSGIRVDFEFEEGRAAGLTIVSPTDARTQLPAAASETVHVAPPTGEVEVDRASIVDALETVRPGGTVRFAPGLYLVGELIPVPTPRITLLGHPDGTILRGCDPESYEKNERESLALESEDPADWWAILNRCGMLELTGGHVTIRDLTFEYSRLGLLLGCCHVDDVFRPAEGGYLIEGSTFRNSGNGIRAILSSSEPTVIRDNDFANVYHALSANVSRVHFLNNHISVPEPERVPATGHPGFAIGISPVPSGAGGTNVPGASVCEQNVIAGNRIEGHPDGIFITAYQPGTTCRENTIRENTIDVQRVRFSVPWIYSDDQPMADDADSTFVGIPLSLMDLSSPSSATGEEREGGRVEHNLVEGNRILGAEGLGIEVLRASRNRIVNNTITGIARRDPFPGNMLGASPEWGEANGAGIWVSPGSNENEIIGNSFSDVASYDVVVEGDSNHVETPAAADAVRDLGERNHVRNEERSASFAAGGNSDSVHEIAAYHENLAKQVVIYRDSSGVPHVHGLTDEAAVFGLAYARAEDQFELIEEIFINRLGRSSEIFGEEGLLTPGLSEKGHDLFVHAFGYLDEGRSGYERLPAKVRSIVDAYTAGLNYYLEQNPEQQVRLLDRFEPWWVVAVEDFSESHRGRVHSGAFEANAETVMRGEWLLPERGSNTWAIGPAKTADGHAMLLMNPHDPSRRPYYECHIMSDEGLNSYGVMNYWGSLLLPYIGFNEHLGWSVTINEPDLGDAFEMSFDHPTDSLRYRFGDAHLEAQSREATIRVNTDTGVVARSVVFTETIHGPVLATAEDGRPLSFRIARAPSGTWTEQLYRMHRARSLEEWKDAVALRGLTYHNLMYADRAGNIFYLYNGNVPVRDDSFDWTAPVDGSDPRTLWNGYHDIEELPQLLNPRAGYLQNANSSPFVTTHDENPEPADFPRYMTNLDDDDTFRAERARLLLRDAEAITLDDLHSMATSTYVHAADEWLPLLFDEWSRLDGDRSDLRDRLREPIAALRAWDRESDAGSFETTLFVLWDEVYWTLWDDEYEGEQHEAQELPLLVSLAGALDVLEREFGTWKVAWSDVFRHQRTADGDAVVWDENRPSYETSANHGRYGTMLNMSGAAYDGVRGSVKRRMTFGNSFVSVVEFTADGPVARSIVAYGNSMRPESPHYRDQAEMFARGLMKPVWFRMDQILANLEESYRPGESRSAK